MQIIGSVGSKIYVKYKYKRIKKVKYKYTCTIYNYNLKLGHWPNTLTLWFIFFNLVCLSIHLFVQFYFDLLSDTIRPCGWLVHQNIQLT